MAKTAEDLADKIGELTEQLTKLAQSEIRRDIADTFLDFAKTDPERLRNYLRSEDVTLHGGTVVQYRSYLPNVDPEAFELSPDFLLGIKFMCAALRDKNLEL